MQIAVCIKQVPDSEQISIDPQTNTLNRASAQAVLNPFDLFAVEEAVRLQQRIPQSHTVALSMGPRQAESTLRESISRGIEEGILLCDRAFAGADCWATSRVLAAGIHKSKAGLVLCGKQATDGDTAQIAPGIAAHLNWPQVCYVTEFIEVDEEYAVVRRLLDTGRETMRVRLPAVFTVLKEINVPRLPNLPGLLRARQATIQSWDQTELQIPEAECGLKGSPTRVRKIYTPHAGKKECRMIQGSTTAVKAQKLAQILQSLL